MPLHAASISVYFLPALFEPAELSGKTAVVFDVLRATSVMIESLANGAKQIIPCASIEDAIRTRDELNDPSRTLLGGERNGLKIDGFDIGNSPVEVTTATVADKTLVMTTTNGTVAIAHCRYAENILIGALSNVTALAHALLNAENVALVCAGTGGEITAEDVLAAGAVVDRLLQRRSTHNGEHVDHELNDQAQIARGLWCNIEPDKQSLVSALRESKGGRNLLRHGKKRFELDIEQAAELDRHDFVPALNADGSITVMENNEMLKPTR